MKYADRLKSTAIGILVLVAGISEGHAAVMPGTPLPQTASAKLWMVPLDTSLGAPHPGGNSGVNAVFPVPAGTPDLTFSTNLIEYTTDGKLNTISGFFPLGSVLSPVFSGLVNGSVGAVVGPNTELVGPSWGTYIEITGRLFLVNGDQVKIDHDDGVSLKLNNTLTGCFADPGGTGHYLASDGPQTCFYSGPSELVPFDLVYTEGFTAPARLSLSLVPVCIPSDNNSCAVPAPSTVVLFGAGLAALVGVAFKRRRDRKLYE
jgi:hypothetical protein